MQLRSRWRVRQLCTNSSHLHRGLKKNLPEGVSLFYLACIPAATRISRTATSLIARGTLRMKWSYCLLGIGTAAARCRVFIVREINAIWIDIHNVIILVSIFLKALIKGIEGLLLGALKCLIRLGENILRAGVRTLESRRLIQMQNPDGWPRPKPSLQFPCAKRFAINWL